MTTVTALTIVLLVAATAACIAMVWLAKELVETARSLRVFSDETRERLIPILDKADVTVDAANAELLRIDAAITRFEEASARVSAASGTLSDIVQAPAEIVNGVADRVRRAWKDRRHHSAAEEADASEYTVEEPMADDATGEYWQEPAAESAHDDANTPVSSSSEDPCPRIE